MAFNTSPRYERVALLIDAENIRPEHLDRLLETARGLGRITVRRAYADWSRRYVQVWRETLAKAAIRPVHHFAIANLKNGVDVAMTVDVLRLLAEEHPDAVVMASGDADMAALVMALREAGVYVYGFGTDQTNASFRACFDHFESLGPDTHPAGEARRAEEVAIKQDKDKESKPSPAKPRIPAGSSRRLSRGPAKKSGRATPAAPEEEAAPPEVQSIPQPEVTAVQPAPEPPPAEPVGPPPPAAAVTEAPVAEGAEPELSENEYFLQAVEAVAGKDGWAYVSSVTDWLMKNRPRFYKQHCQKGRMSRRLARLPEFWVDGDKVRRDDRSQQPPAGQQEEERQPEQIQAPAIQTPPEATAAQAEAEPEPQTQTAEPAEVSAESLLIEDTLEEAVRATLDNQGTTTVLALGRWLARERPEFHRQHLGRGKLTPLLEASDRFQVERQGRARRVTLADEAGPKQGIEDSSIASDTDWQP